MAPHRKGQASKGYTRHWFLKPLYLHLGLQLNGTEKMDRGFIGEIMMVLNTPLQTLIPLFFFLLQ